MNKTNMEAIAQKAGLSKNTVSVALRGMPGISPETRARILAIAQEMGYSYKKKAVEKRPRSQNLCIIVPTIAHDRQGFFAHIQLGIEQEARKNHFNMIFHSYEDDGRRFEMPLCVQEGLVSGIISVGRISEATAAAIRKTGLPFVMADHFLESAPGDCVLTDNIQGGDTATEYLIRMGHRDIGFFGDINAATSYCDRYIGFRRAMARHGLTVNESHCMTQKGLDEQLRSDHDISVEVMNKLGGLPTAFFCVNDAAAISLYRTLSELNLALPQDVSVMGFDDTEASELVSPALSTMHVHKELLGRRAFLRLLSCIREPQRVSEKLLLSADLVVRNSVRDLTGTRPE